jgi:hypothetical protein
MHFDQHNDGDDDCMPSRLSAPFTRSITAWLPAHSTWVAAAISACDVKGGLQIKNESDAIGVAIYERPA